MVHYVLKQYNISSVDFSTAVSSYASIHLLLTLLHVKYKTSISNYKLLLLEVPTAVIVLLCMVFNHSFQVQYNHITPNQSNLYNTMYAICLWWKCFTNREDK